MTYPEGGPEGYVGLSIRGAVDTCPPCIPGGVEIAVPFDVSILTGNCTMLGLWRCVFPPIPIPGFIPVTVPMEGSSICAGRSGLESSEGADVGEIAGDESRRCWWSSGEGIGCASEGRSGESLGSTSMKACLCWVVIGQGCCLSLFLSLSKTGRTAT
jgi:hypothetical protein